MTTIPASQLVNVIPSVITAGGNAINVIGLILTTNPRVPIGSVISFSSAAAVSSYFGATSNEALAANVYFAGFTGSTVLPGSVLFSQYNTAAVSAYLRGGSIGGTTLTQIQAINATLTVTIDGTQKSSTVNLAAATSFSNAAEIIGASLGIAGTLVGSVTGSITTTTLTVSGTPSFTIAPGQVISGTGVTPNTYIVSQLSGTPGGGGGATYQVSVSQSVASTSITFNNPGCQFDSIANAFVINSGTTGPTSTMTFATGAAAALLFLTAANGAVLSQGANAATPNAFMTALVVQTQNWVTFMTLFDPDNGVGNTQKQAFATWKNSQNNRYAYIAWDPDTTPINNLPAPASLGQILQAANDSGTCVISESAEVGSWLAAFVCGVAASINFNQTAGRITFAYKSQPGLVANVTTGQAATNLLGNFYNFYGAYGAANNTFVNFQNGQCTGTFKWLDSYINQVWLNATFQVALLTFLSNINSVPYSDAGNALIQNALKPTIQQGLAFGAYAPGTISASEAAAINAAAGNQTAAATVQQQGWYLQVQNASSTVRAARASPPCTFWYLDRGSVQQITLASIEVQ